MAKVIIDADLDCIFNVPPVTEAPHYDSIRCVAFNCVYNANGLCTEEHEVPPIMFNGQCEYAEIDKRVCEQCGELKQEIGFKYGGHVVTEFGCPNNH